MKISVLLPTRNRVERVKKSLNSLYDTVSDVNILEVFLGLDFDDPSLDELKNMVLDDFKDFNIIFCISDIRHGYFNLHEYYNMMVKKASGDWIFIWGDDSYIITEDWDKLVKPYENKFILLSPKVKERPKYPGTMFPIIPKLWADTLGHISLNCHNDTWVEVIAQKLKIFKYIPMWVSHERYNKDETGKEKRSNSKEFRSKTMANLREDDIIKLRAVCK